MSKHIHLYQPLYFLGYTEAASVLSNEANLLVQPPQVPDHPVTLDLFAPAASDVAVTPGRPVVSLILPKLLNPITLRAIPAKFTTPGGTAF